MSHSIRPSGVARFLRLVPCLALLLLARPLFAAEYHTLMQRPDRLIVQLPNGLVVIVQRVATAPVVSVQTFVKTGSIYEQQHNGAGLSHFLEHLLSGGSTSTRTEDQNNEILGRIGAQVNASTGLDTVNYYINTASEFAPQAIELLSDWMQHSLITDNEYQRERQVIQREFDMGQGEPGRIFWKLTQQVRYATHPARHPTIGYLDEFLRISRDEIYAFYKRMYAPNNIVFVVAGDVDVKATVDLIAKQWGDSKPGSLPVITFPIEPPIQGPKETSGEADIDRPRLRLAWPGTRLAAPCDYELDLLTQVLGEGELSRLVQVVRNGKQLVTSIDSYNASFAWGEGFIGIDAVTTAEQMPAARQAILDEVARLLREGVTEDELARAKRKTLAGIVYDSQTAQGAAARLARDFIQTGDPDYLQRYAAAIQKITTKQLQEAAQKYLRPDRLIVVKLMPQTAKLELTTRPADTQPAAAGPVETVDLDNARLVARFQRLAAEAAAPAKAPEINPVKMIRLDNGLRVLLQRNTALPIVSIQCYSLGGLLADQPGHEGVANAVSRMLMKGAAGRSADDIARRLEELGAVMSTGCGNSTAYTQAMCLADDWPVVLDLAADVMLKPDFPEPEWLRMRPRLLAAIDSINDSWSGELNTEFRKAYFGNHPWSQTTLGRRAVVEQIAAADLRTFHQRNLAARRSVLAVFGDFDEQRVEQAIKARFSAMPAGPDAPLELPPRTEPAPGIMQVATKKPLAAVEIGYGPGMARNNDDYAPMLVLTNVLSSFPYGRLDEALRGKQTGLVYAVGAYQQTGYIPGYWAAVFNTQPQTAVEAAKRALAVINAVKTQPVDDASLQRARVAVLVGEALGLQTSAQRGADAALDELYGVGYDATTKMLQRIRSADAAELQRVANRYLAQPIIVVLTHEPVPPADLSAIK